MLRYTLRQCSALSSRIYLLSTGSTDILQHVRCAVSVD